MIKLGLDYYLSGFSLLSSLPRVLTAHYVYVRLAVDACLWRFTDEPAALCPGRTLSLLVCLVFVCSLLDSVRFDCSCLESIRLETSAEGQCRGRVQQTHTCGICA